ncbi:hypothetical protein FRC14_002954 [Serendipita sp. 396]|nr:hypothetical protein FRC14_002954 [Serendipita sp. 396]KAG8823629.1 hypothetical protein FRC19_003427 [Serendipita sp. 401]KAG8834917.1 hypothetical protein FRC18_001298 [Serendipita sp. 400]KAG8844357.1 hypothetical protein FRB91_002674 [Serendipita sp. 411]KAG9055437.1 hypothetical protein FS842_002177 [Serendipita sp. 407]
MASKQVGKVMVRLVIPAGKASPSPPVGPALGAKGVKSMDFCKEFNAKTEHIEPGLPIPTKIHIAPDRSFTFAAKTPPVSYFLKKTAGIEKGSGKPGGAPIATVSVKHVYEIAKIKHIDSAHTNTSLESVVRGIIATAKTLGIKVVL